MAAVHDEMRIGIVGSRKYTNSLKIKEFIWQLKQKFSNRLTIVSGGQPLGADGYAAQWAKYFEINYAEFPPRHFQWNRFCIKHPGWYNQPYRVSHFFTRNSEVVNHSHKMVFFIPSGTEIEESRGSFDTYRKAKKRDIGVVILN